MKTLQTISDKELYALEAIARLLKDEREFYERVRKEMFRRGFMIYP